MKMTRFMSIDRNDSESSSGSREHQLMHMSSYVLVKVFKFLSLTERVKTERIHSSFVPILNHVWSKQRSLVISFNPTFANQTCSHKEHKFFFEDVFYDQEKEICHWDRSFFKLIMKCPNLKNLHLLSNPILTKSFGSDLFQYCWNLEHIEIRDTATYVSFASYVSRVRKSQLTCIHLNDFDDDADEEIESAIISTIKRSPKLDTFINMSIWNTKVIIQEVLPRVTDYRVNTLPDMTLIDVIGVLGGKTLKSFAIREILALERAEAIVEKLVKLKRLEINIDGEELKTWFKTVTRLVRAGVREPLEDLSIFPGHEYYDVKDNDHFLSNNGRHLKSLSLWSYQLRGHSLRYIHQFCPDLEELRVYARQEIDLKPWYRSLARLTRLKKLELKEAVMTARQITHVLNALVNLEEIHLILFDFTPPIKNQLINYARRHTRRQINVYVDFKLKQAPPPVVFGTQPIFSYNICECHENLRIWYAH